MNEVIKTITNRSSLRDYDDRGLSQEHLDNIISCALRAPTAGNMMMYSILLITNQKTKETLAKSCDNQPFIANAPVIMVFLADLQKWYDYYMYKNVSSYATKNNLNFEAPRESDFILACEDALAAAENAVIAAESLNIGSCYIGDILENYELHRDLFNLPEWVVPVTMVCFGYYKEDYKKTITDRFDKKYVVFENEYQHLSNKELDKMFLDRAHTFNSNNKYEADNFAQMHFARKSGAKYNDEMARSVRVALKNFSGRKINY